MRKILASFLAASMVASIGATMSFAAPAQVAATPSEIIVDMSGVSLETMNGGNPLAAGTAIKTAPQLAIRTSNGGSIAIGVAKTDIKVGMGSADIAKAFAAAANANPTQCTLTSVSDADALALTATDLRFSARGSNLIITTVKSGPGSSIGVDGTYTISPVASTANTDADAEFATGVVRPSAKAGLPATTVTVDDENTTGVDIRDIVECGRDGQPIPLTEDPAGVDKDLNGSEGAQSGKTVYFMIKDGGKKFDDDTYWKLKVTKGDNGKHINKISDVSKSFKNDLYNVNTETPVLGTGGSRHRYIKVEMNELFTTDEYKMTLDMRLSPKSKAVSVFGVDDDAELKVKDFSFYMKNLEKEADNDWKVGLSGLMLKPLSNDWNNVTWYDEDGDLAHLKFFADSDVDSFYSKLSTKWDNADYASYFNDQDAFKFEFTGSPNLSATSRADLEIYSPFVDEDGNETINPETAVIYQVIDGELINVSDSFTYTEGDNGDMAYKARTRFLGTYIICEKEVEEASNGEVPDELAPDEIAPDDTMTPDAKPDNGGKAPANTGKYL